MRQLLGDLAADERRREARAEELPSRYVPAGVEKAEDESERCPFLVDGPLGFSLPHGVHRAAARPSNASVDA